MDKLDAEFQFGKQALDLRAYRQQIISANIANADTPGYKARDMDFASTLTRAVGSHGGGNGSPGSTTLSTSGPVGGSAGPGNGFGSGFGGGSGGGLQMTATSPSHLAGMAGSAAAAGAAAYGTPQYRTPNQPSLDGNTVEMDTERVNFADNALHYETGLNIMSQQVKTMLAAVSGGQ